MCRELSLAIVYPAAGWCGVCVPAQVKTMQRIAARGAAYVDTEQARLTKMMGQGSLSHAKKELFGAILQASQARRTQGTLVIDNIIQ